MTTASLKTSLFREIDALDHIRLKEVYGLMLNYINSNSDSATWLDVPDEHIQGIEAAIIQLNAGQGIAHAELLQKFRIKYDYTCAKK